MLKNNLTIALRTLLKFKGYTTVNLLGLSLGLTTGILILMYVTDELAFDKFHANGKRIYRVNTVMADLKTNAKNKEIEANGWPIGALLKKDYPEVEAVIYFRNSSLPVIHEGKRIEQKIFFASDDVFNIFSFPLKEGNPSKALTDPNSVVISESMERKYFGDKEALGNAMVFADTLSFIVTGVMKDLPTQSHMQFDMLVSFSTYTDIIEREFTYSDGWGNLNVRNYVLLKEGVNKEDFFAKSANLYMNYVKEDLKKYGMFLYLNFEPLEDIYLRSRAGNGMGPSGSIQRVYLVTGVAIFVILLACINFINLSTSRSTYRAKEVGLRKVVGSSRMSLVRQFLTESLLLTTISFFTALVLVGLLLPLFNELVGKSYSLAFLTQPLLIIGSIILIIMISILAGYYPALVISGLRPSEVLKGKMSSSPRGVRLRQGLVVFQFAISAGLIICTLIVKNQLNYMKDQELGFFGDQIIVVNAAKAPSSRHEIFKNDLKNLSNIDNVSLSNAVPGKPGWIGQWAYAAEKTPDETIGVEYMTIDENYIETLGLKIIAGHNFDINRPADFKDGLVINEETVKQMGWETPENSIGKKITSPSLHPAGMVIGVVKNYHEFGLQKKIYPMTMAYRPEYSRYLAIKFKAGEISSVLSNIKTAWKKHYEGYDLDYFFLDENFETQYQNERRLTSVFTLFSVITVIIAIVGLAGLVSFMVVSRRKEIGVRKILGGSIFSIARLLSTEFLVLVLIAIAIACPVTFYLANQWLQDFAYHAPVGIDVFLVVIAAGPILTLLTVGFQIVKAALSNPVDSLRSE